MMEAVKFLSLEVRNKDCTGDPQIFLVILAALGESPCTSGLKKMGKARVIVGSRNRHHEGDYHEAEDDPDNIQRYFHLIAPSALASA